MNVSGEELINIICEKLKFEGKLCKDTKIISLLRSLNNYELNELITFRTTAKWVRDTTRK